MNIFLTWSGTKSHAVAQALREWIPSVLQRVKPFLSSEDIRKGTRWQNEIAAQLAEVQYAIVCLTADNLKAPWIHFEAGAVSKHVQSGKVTALLVGVNPGEVQGPLVQFQHTSASREDIRRLMTELNSLLGPEALRAEHFTDAFDMYWPRLETKLQAAQKDAGAPVPAPKRTMEEMVAEVLEINRNSGRAIATMVHVQQQLSDQMMRIELSSSSKYSTVYAGPGLLAHPGSGWVRTGLGGLGDPPLPLADQATIAASVNALRRRSILGIDEQPSSSQDSNKDDNGKK